MAVKDSVKDKAGPEPLDDLFRGPRAGNTTQTMAPKTVNVLDPEPSWKPKEEIYGPDEPVFEPKGRKPAPISRQSFEQRVTAKSPTTLENRVTKLEEQMDALRDRIAVHNIRAQHKL
jgi:hypothetical protein